MLPCIVQGQQPLINPAQIAKLQFNSGTVVVKWQGGSATSQVQCATSMAGPWQDVDIPTLGTSVTNIVSQPSAFYRVISIVTNPAAATDKIAPTVPSGFLTAAVSCSQVNLSWNASTDPSPSSGLKGYDIYRNNIFLKQVPATTLSTTDLNLSGATTYTYGILAIDNAGHYSAKTNLTVTTPACPPPPDTIPPTVTLTSPATGSTVSNSVTLSASASDNSGGSGVARVEFYCDSQGTLLGSVTSAPYSYACDTTAMPNGNHIFYCKAYDAAGNSSISLSNSVVVSNPSTGKFLWSKVGTVPLYATPVNVAVDHSGNTVEVGFFQNTVDFGGGPLSSAGGYDGFVAKYNAQGGFLWAKRYGSLGSQEAVKGVAIDSSDNIIITGYFGGTVDFGGQLLTAPGNSSDPYATDIFVAKYDNANPPHLLWVKQFGGSSSDFGKAVAVDAGGNILLGAQFSSVAITFGTTTLTNTGGMAVVKLAASSGSVMWAKGWGGSELSLSAIAVDNSGDVVTAGGFWSTTDIGGGMRSSAGGYGIFAAKYSGLDGHHMWDRGIGSSSSASQIANGVATDPVTGNVVITGQYGGAASFGGPITDFFGNANTAGGAFLAAYDSSGNYLWAKTPNMAAYGFSDEDGYGVTIDGGGNIYFTGKVNSAVYFTGSQILLGGHASFLASLTSSGVARWGIRSGGASGIGMSLAVDTSGHLLVAGQVSNSTMYFDENAGATNGSVSTVSGTTAPFVAQFSR